jgi:RHS repeat-associated protein
VSGTNSYVTSTGYDSAGRIISRALGNTLTQTFTYNPWTVQGGRLQNISTGTLQSLTYTYDSVGNIKTIIDVKNASQKQCFQYDALDRLTNATTYGDTPQGCTTQLGEGNYNESYGYNSATGNLDAKAGVTLQYTDSSHKHAVTSAGGNNYTYDANGNMVSRDINSGALIGDYTLSYDAENRLVGVTKNNASIATFVYDGDGKQVKATINAVTTIYVGAHYEVTGGVATKYYFAGSTRIALRKVTVLNYLLADHLGSSSLTTDANGALTATMLYGAWGGTRYSTGILNTKYEYTGQRNEVGIGLYFYGARWYDDYLGRMAQADTIVPAGVQGYDRYAYVQNNPLRYTDPTGHKPCWATEKYSCDKRDVTKWLADALTDTASSAEIAFIYSYLSGESTKMDGSGNFLAAMAMYFQLVRPGGKYDVKLKIQGVLHTDVVKIGNNWYEYSTTGNILFGYYSNAAGFTLEEIQKGAGYVQKYDYWRKGCPEDPKCDTVLGTEDTYFDSPDDFSAIQFGHELFDSNAASDGVITADELTIALDDYAAPYPLDIKPDPGGFMPGGPYPADYFYQWK